MCKPKNRVVCPDCGRPKMLFESELKANNFIRFNKDNLEYGTDKLRPYYCPACCGWHISHHKYNKNMEGHTDRLIEAYKKDNKSHKKIHEEIEYRLIDELFNILENSHLSTREEVNDYLKRYTSKYNDFIINEAKIKYYQKYNIKKVIKLHKVYQF